MFKVIDPDDVKDHYIELIQNIFVIYLMEAR